jgi:hypothetical protein
LERADWGALPVDAIPGWAGEGTRISRMTIRRYAAKTDSNQPPIVDAIRNAGWECYLVREPCDLFCYHAGYEIWAPLEIKDPTKVTKAGKPVHDERMAEQHEFLERTKTPVVTTPAEALIALAAVIDRHLQRVAA